MRHEPMRHRSTNGRRGALLGASAAALCLSGVLAACGSGGGGGYAAVGAADGSAGASGAVAAPSGEVSLAPLDGPSGKGSNTAGGRGSSGSGKGGSAAGPGGSSTDGTGDTDASGGSTAGPGGSAGGEDGSGNGANSAGSGATSPSGSPRESPSGGDSGSTGGSSGGSPTPPAPAPTVSARPAALSVGEPSRAATDRRWCEKVTASFTNTGGTAVRSGTVTFGTHIIGALGIDWATIRSTEPLPAPIAAGARKSGTWTVCVDSWRVPLGMHVETQDVSVDWK
ncbi:hypothetical protein AB0F46_14365 [Streptomyces sp. NPDC026665]|uniref:hypothetical protein n=1 Tax=Streptomyces sp. NPDC026665 TaxID=3154798 RepID=UPI0033D11794